MTPEEHLKRIKLITKLQANDEALWCDAQHISEAMIQRALRYLHSVIEQDGLEEVYEDKND